MYRSAHVPVALSTDDEGVSRIDLTHEYVRAAIDYNLSYRDLKQLARTGMEHGFLPGASLWIKPDDLPQCGRRVPRPGARRRQPDERVQGISRQQREGCGAMGTGAPVQGV